MNLITIKEIYKNREHYLDKEVTVGGWGKKYPGFQIFRFYRIK